MTVRLIMFAATAMSAAAMATAEPAQSDSRDSNQANNRPAEVVLASAEQEPNGDADAEAQPADAQPPATPPKRQRAARVTTCRCGDPGQ